jgi:hypothetical protein
VYDLVMPLRSERFRENIGNLAFCWYIHQGDLICLERMAYEVILYVDVL